MVFHILLLGCDSAANYLSHVLLTEKLLPLLEQSHNNPRIVFLCSKLFRGVSGSALSCPALSKKLSLSSSSHVGVLSVCPGGVVTNIHTSKKGLTSS